jgi:hypothetical protein
LADRAILLTGQFCHRFRDRIDFIGFIRIDVSDAPDVTQQRIRRSVRRSGSEGRGAHGVLLFLTLIGPTLRSLAPVAVQVAVEAAVVADWAWA